MSRILENRINVTSTVWSIRNNMIVLTTELSNGNRNINEMVITQQSLNQLNTIKTTKEAEIVKLNEMIATIQAELTSLNSVINQL